MLRIGKIAAVFGFALLLPVVASAQARSAAWSETRREPCFRA